MSDNKQSPKTFRVTVRLTAEQRSKLRSIARKQRRKSSAVLRDALSLFFASHAA